MGKYFGEYALNSHAVLRAAAFLLVTALLLHGCASGRALNVTMDDFDLLKKGMTSEQIVEILGEPNDRIEKSTAFIVHIYELKTGQKINLGFFPEANYLDSAYLFNSDGEKEQSLIPTSQSFPSGLVRKLMLSDFDGLMAGVEYFFEVYYQVGGPNESILFEGGEVSLIYNLSDGGRIGMNTHGGYGCISRIGYSPESFGPNWTVLSEDTQRICKQQ